MTSISPVVSPILGVDVEAVDSSQVFPLGTKILADNGTTYMYIKAGTALSQHLAYIIDSSFTASSALTTTSAGDAPVRVGVPQMSGGIANGSYGWVAVEGPMTVTVAASCAADVPLYTTGTAGVLDDASGAGQKLVSGVKINTANGGSTAAVAGESVIPLSVLS